MKDTLEESDNLRELYKAVKVYIESEEIRERHLNYRYMALIMEKLSDYCRKEEK